jgi:patatin-like phospholipase
MILLALALLAAPPPSGMRGRLALTISGGVSLGSYEAGLTWAIVGYLRASDRGTDLAAVTGASAGAVNALMAAAMWCEERTETRDEHPDTNLFHDLWAPVGLEDLLPEDPSAFTAADGVLTAAPLERAFRRLREEVFESNALRLKPGCTVSVGLTVTRDRPEERTVAGLPARRQRFVIPWRFEVDQTGQARIVSAPLTSDRDSSDAQLLLGERRGLSGIGALQVTQAALASGAVPFAFRPRQLCDCSLRCPELRRSARAAFVIAKLSRLEVTAQLGNRSAAALLLAEPAWNWLGEPRLSAGDQLGTALLAVTSRTGPCHEGAIESLCLADPTFDELLDALQLSGYVPSSPSMREALSDRDRWTAHLAGRLVDRAAAVEISSSERARRAPSDVVLTGLGLGQLWARRAQRLSGAATLDLDPSTIPRRSPEGAHPALLVAAHLVPYRVSLDVVRGGAAFSWIEPALRLSSWFSVDSVADLLAIEGSGRVTSIFGLIPTLRVRGVALGVGAQSVLPWNGDGALTPGVIGRIGLLQERLAITFGIRSLSLGHREALVALSVSDLNGLAYWLALWGAARK